MIRIIGLSDTVCLLFNDFRWTIGKTNVWSTVRYISNHLNAPNILVSNYLNFPYEHGVRASLFLIFGHLRKWEGGLTRDGMDYCAFSLIFSKHRWDQYFWRTLGDTRPRPILWPIFWKHWLYFKNIGWEDQYFGEFFLYETETQKSSKISVQSQPMHSDVCCRYFNPWSANIASSRRLTLFLPKICKYGIFLDILCDITKTWAFWSFRSA